MQGKPMREDPHSLAPIQLDRPRLEHDLASIKRGQNRNMTLALVGTTLAMVGLLQWMKSIDGRQAYSAAANQLEEFRTEHGERCDLLQPHPSKEMLRGAIKSESQRYHKAYGQRLAGCSEALVVFDRELKSLDVPLNMQRRVDELRGSAHALNLTIGSYRSYLLDPTRKYDVGEAAPFIDDMALAWHDYQRHHRTTIDALRAAAPPR